MLCLRTRSVRHRRGRGRGRSTAARWRAEKWARRLVRDKIGFAPAMGHLLFAGAHSVRGDRQRALQALELALPLLDAADLGYLAACARYRRGQLLGGAAGRELVARSEGFFASQGVMSPERCLAMSAPGFPA